MFINYDKQDDIADTIRYEDRFISPDILIAISKSGRSVEIEYRLDTPVRADLYDYITQN